MTQVAKPPPKRGTKPAPPPAPPELVSARTLRRATARLDRKLDALLRYVDLIPQGFAAVHNGIKTTREEMQALSTRVAERFDGIGCRDKEEAALAAVGRVDADVARDLFLERLGEVAEEVRVLVHIALDAHVAAAIPPSLPRWTEEQREAFLRGVRDTYRRGARA